MSAEKAEERVMMFGLSAHPGLVIGKVDTDSWEGTEIKIKDARIIIQDKDKKLGRMVNVPLKFPMGIDNVSLSRDSIVWSAYPPEATIRSYREAVSGITLPPSVQKA